MPLPPGDATAARGVPGTAGSLLVLLVAPLVAPALLAGSALLVRLALGDEIPDAAWLALLALGPAIPLYVLLLPLLPFLVRQLRRGWAPPFSRVLGAALLASVLIDAVFYLARRSPA